MKICLQCKASKPLSEYHKDKSRSNGYREKCKECRCKKPKVVHKNCLACNDMFEVRGYSKAQKYCGVKCQQMYLKYGIDEYRYEDLLIHQNYCCAICKRPETLIDPRTGRLFELAVDHCHKTGNIRGLLCTKCNGGLGLFEDNAEFLMSAIEYVNYYTAELKSIPERPEYKGKCRRHQIIKKLPVI